MVQSPNISNCLDVSCDLGTGSIRVAIKDVADIEGIPTRLGSAAFSDAAPAEKNARVVDQLLARDFRIIGKAKMHELAYGVTGLNPHSGTPTNVKFPALIPGGSSSGSAVAVAAGVCDASIGTDTGGSVRVPAACCGVLGLKPTYGRVSRDGFTPSKSSLDCVGAFAKDAQTLSSIMSAIVDDWKEGSNHNQHKLKFLNCDADHKILSATQSAAQLIDLNMTHGTFDLLDPAHQAGLTIIAHETYAAFGALLGRCDIDREVAKRLQGAAAISDEDIQDAEQVRDAAQIQIDDLLDSCDVLALPTLSGFPPAVADAGDLRAMVKITSLCRPFNLSGHPAIAIPLPPIDDRPLSLQLVARRGEDETLVEIAKSFEQIPELAPASVESCNV